MQNMDKGKLYIIASPIGNLSDITLRGIETLKEVDMILSEDTRETDKVLKKYDIQKPQLSYRDQNHNYIFPRLVESLENGLSLALISDSGTPLISDPGYKLVRDLIKKGIDPIAFRMWLYSSNYQTKTNFTLESVEGSMSALKKLRDFYIALGEDVGEINKEYKAKFVEYLDNNLDSPKALALLWDLVKDKKVADKDKKTTMLDFDKVFGFGLDKLIKEEIPEDILEIVKEREKARKNKDWKKSDELRDKINSLGYEIKDTENGPLVSKI